MKPLSISQTHAIARSLLTESALDEHHHGGGPQWNGRRRRFGTDDQGGSGGRWWQCWWPQFQVFRVGVASVSTGGVRRCDERPGGVEAVYVEYAGDDGPAVPQEARRSKRARRP